MFIKNTHEHYRVCIWVILGSNEYVRPLHLFENDLVKLPTESIEGQRSKVANTYRLKSLSKETLGLEVR